MSGCHRKRGEYRFFFSRRHSNNMSKQPPKKTSMIDKIHISSQLSFEYFSPAVVGATVGGNDVGGGVTVGIEDTVGLPLIVGVAVGKPTGFGVARR